MLVTSIDAARSRSASLHLQDLDLVFCGFACQGACSIGKCNGLAHEVRCVPC